MGHFRYENELSKFLGASRLDRLRSYYRTWKLPSHPHDPALYEVVLLLVRRREMNWLIYASTETGRFDGDSSEVPTVATIQQMLSQFETADDWDKKIIGHALAHCELLAELESVSRSD